jgi:hypothetical protein
MTAVAEHVGPFAEPGADRGELPAAELPRGSDHLLVVAAASQVGDVNCGAERAVGDTGGVEGFGGVLGDVVRAWK